MSSYIEFKKVLNLKDILFLSFGAMIGWGWVVLVGNWIITAGSLGSIISFLLGGILIIFVGLAYSELTASIQSNCGELFFCYKALGFNFAFISIWFILLGYISVISFEVVALPSVIEYLIPNLKFLLLYNINDNPIYLSWILVSLMGSFFIYLLNYFGIKFATKIQNILTLIIFLVGILLLIGSLTKGNLINLNPKITNGFNGIFKIFLITPFMFIGFNVIPQVFNEINLSPKKIGLILIFSIFLATFWYIMIIFSVSYSMNINQIKNSTLVTADAMKIVYHSSWSSILLVVGGIFGIITTWNAFYIGCSRIIYNMSKIGMMPDSLGKLNKKYFTPVNTLLLILIITIIPAFFGKRMLYWLSNAGSFGIIIAYFLVSISFLVMRKKYPKIKRPFKVKYGILVGCIASLFCLFFLILFIPGSPIALQWPYEWMILVLWCLFGLLFYIFSIRRHSKEQIKEKIELNLIQNNNF